MELHPTPEDQEVTAQATIQPPATHLTPEAPPGPEAEAAAEAAPPPPHEGEAMHLHHSEVEAPTTATLDPIAETGDTAHPVDHPPATLKPIMVTTMPHNPTTTGEEAEETPQTEVKPSS